MQADDLQSTARALVAPGKGILAADESTGTIAKRFEAIGVESSTENRRAYRELLFATRALGEFISGVILYDETIRQQAVDGTSLVELLKEQNIIPGIKVDRGAKALAMCPGETVTEGLDGLRDRLAEYLNLGARFTKWRAVLTVGPRLPTPACLSANAHALARFAALSQEAGLVPIVEPEVLMDGSHTIERCAEVTELALRAVFQELARSGVNLEGMLLKPNMVISGKECLEQAGVEQVAEATLRCLRRTVPAAVPGIVFLSGGQSGLRATQHLNAMNRLGPAPWALSFSYGRALQEPVLTIWQGRAENAAAAQKKLYRLGKANSLARFGEYADEAD